MGPDGATELAELLKEVRRIDLQSRRLVTGVLAGGYRSAFLGAGLEFEGVREYVEGDDPRSVDWSVTARFGRPFVKTFTEERERTVLFLLDLSPSMGGGLGPWSARQVAARVCACLALSAARAGDKAGLIAFDREVRTFVEPRRGLSHALRVVRDCLVLPAGEPGPGARSDPSPALRLAAQAIRRRAIVFLVSDFLWEPPAGPLARCARRHDLVAVRLLLPELDPDLSGLSRIGLLRAADPETGEERWIDLRNRRARAGWSAATEAWRARTEEELSRARIDRMDVPVPREPGGEPIAGPILRFFRMRELRGTKR